MIYKKNIEMEFIQTDENGLVVFDPASGQTYILDDIGIAILGAMGEGASLDSIVSVLCREYAAPPEEIQTDVEDFINELLGQGILLSCE